MPHTVTNISRFLSHETRNKIRELISFDRDDYAANVESRLRNLGEHELANKMLREIAQSMEEGQ